MSSTVTSQLLEQEIMGNFDKNNWINKSFYCISLNVILFNLLYTAEEPWCPDTKLYQPYEAEQILLAENASCLAAKAYLNVNQWMTMFCFM